MNSIHSLPFTFTLVVSALLLRVKPKGQVRFETDETRRAETCSEEIGGRSRVVPSDRQTDAFVYTLRLHTSKRST